MASWISSFQREKGMKRNRAEPAPQTPAKTPRRYAATSAHQKLPQQLPQKSQSRGAEEKRAPPRDTPGVPSSSSSSSLSTAEAVAAAAAATQEIEWAQHAGWDSVGELAGAWSTWGVAEETLLGWFPFADEHFHGAGPFWEEESYCCCSYCYYHDDIWHLQHIHEAPNKN